MERKKQIILVGLALLLVAILLIATLLISAEKNYSTNHFYFEKPVNQNYISYQNNNQEAVMVPWNVQTLRTNCQRIR